MKAKWSWVLVLVVGFFLMNLALPLHAQNAPKNFTLLYSNNFNGEIEPCPS